MDLAQALCDVAWLGKRVAASGEKPDEGFHNQNGSY
jgi:hypothetical protein